ncbi:hypothetical protein DYB26_015966 [Aphanomyces astaci]|uniref:Uncharacterized protein n=1 Tax=Aphanomyces astaci TaxID=112090 RepID=A0A397F9S3_APHAT|nr:hypothetical protein DYB31_012497 [Aphanomyces astaci]RHZ39518.1 hypothetical protein DYB26_015966 [Aphanomyces astaci]
MSRSNAWHSATLVADPSARNLGKEWLTQQMYHNMHEPFALFPVVSYDEDFYQFDFQASDEHGDHFTCMDRISPTHILLRLVSHVSHLFRPATGFVSVDEFAALRGIDVTGIEDGQKDEYVRREMIRREHASFLPWRQRFMDLMHQSATN